MNGKILKDDMGHEDDNDECSHGAHGPWCREWEKMKKRAELAEADLKDLFEAVEDLIQAPGPGEYPGGCYGDCSSVYREPRCEENSEAWANLHKTMNELRNDKL